jgi:hypothetical protein
MSMEGVLLSVLLTAAFLHLVWRWGLLASVAPGMQRRSAQVVVAVRLCVALRRSLHRVARCATPLTTTVWGADRHASAHGAHGHVARHGDGRACFFTFLPAFVVMFGVLANALLLSGAGAGAVLSGLATTARTVAVAAAVVLVGVIALVVAVGIEEPGARRWALGDLRVGMVWNGGRSGHGPGDASLPGQGFARAGTCPATFATGSS